MKTFKYQISSPTPETVLIKFRSQRGREKERTHRIVTTDLSLLDLIENDCCQFDKVTAPMIQHELRRSYDSDKKVEVC